jgi:uncharacterized protein
MLGMTSWTPSDTSVHTHRASDQHHTRSSDRAMVIVACRFKLRLAMSRSLKAKRQIVKSVIGQVRSRFDVTIAEVGDHDLWQLAEIGAACVTSDVSHGHQVMSHVASFVAGAKLGEAELLNYETEVVEVF